MWDLRGVFMIIVILIIFISYTLLFALVKAASKDNYKDFEEFKDNSNIKDDESNIR